MGPGQRVPAQPEHPARRLIGISVAGPVVGSICAVHRGGRWRGCGALAGLIGLSLVAGGVTVPSGAADEPVDPVRILLVGDSVTQGSAGDWTWRYRLWKHFQAAGVAVDFVGPRDDLYDNVSATLGSQAYVDAAFDRDHAARWGMSVDVPDVPIATLVEEYRPDVVVEMLGVNDLVFGGRAPETVANRVGDSSTRPGRPTPACRWCSPRRPRPGSRAWPTSTPGCPRWRRPPRPWRRAWSWRTPTPATTGSPTPGTSRTPTRSGRR